MTPLVTNQETLTNMKKLNHRIGPGPDVRTQGRCKVCTKQICTGEDHAKVFHGGSYYLVCCASCAAKFEAHPQQYLVS